MDIQQFHVIGISIVTTNENGQSAQDIPALWQRSFQKNISALIPNKIDDTIYSIYTDYEKDHTKPIQLYGCRVSTLDVIPEGMTGKTINSGKYLCR
ncbi:GyrI-like domain-containing protein [Chitinophaga pinensis]|uniref:GyrI-like domain-containing protein n=1 Tax=Chitinophaga pinensis TaxID=79329 RepID=UPI001C99E63C|nr:effector binding domain-containing protein [Chitinophaga pinensis]